MNKDESVRCIHLARKAVEAGDEGKAKRLLEKSIRLFPNAEAEGLLNELNRPKDDGKDNEDSGSRPRSPSSSRRNRSHSGGPHQREKAHHNQASPEFSESRPGTETHREYSEEQLQAVVRVKKCTTFYEVLHVEKEKFSEAVLKKQYRKLALILHPDKNKAPGAGEAFKIVGKAYAVLSNAQKKAEYDAGGDNYEAARYNPQFARQQGRRRYYRQGNFMFFEDDTTADDIFNMFFGQGFNRFHDEDEEERRHHHPAYRRAQPDNGARHTSGFTLLLQLSPLLIFLALSALSSLTYSEPVYSLQQSSKYPIAMKTRQLDVRYYIKEDAQGKLTAKEQRSMEQNVEEIYLGNLKESCRREQAYKENVMWRGRLYGDNKLVQKGRELETPSCDNLARAYQKLAA